MSGPVDHARLIWSARDEASRLHRLAVDTARHQADIAARLDDGDARCYRCSGCGQWRYSSQNRRYPGSRVRCDTCRAPAQIVPTQRRRSP